MLSDKRRHGGSVLIEALLTIVVLAIGLAAVIRSMSTSVRALSYTTAYTNACLLAENKLFEFVSKGVVRAPFREEKPFAPPFEHFRYRIETEKFAPNDAEGKLNRLQCEVLWPTGRSLKSIKLNTYLFNQSQP